MVTFTFVRHGESTDNLKALWAGWRDAPLSNHGMNQAKAVGKALSNTQFTAILSSDLKRALMTAEAIRDQQQAPQSPVIQSPLLREQNFGTAEGNPWKARRRLGLSLEENYAKGVFPALRSRQEKFPEGESLEDLAARAEQAIQDLLLPYAATDGDIHIAIASHGLFIKEILSVLLRMNADGVDETALDQVWRGLRNTAWTRLKIEMRNDPPGLGVTAIAINQYDHLSTVARQRGGIGSLAHDPKQDIRNFFGGGN